MLADFQEGKVDVLIGTHRILSRDVIPKELGLVILDEEQRFGVAQKELLRSLRLEVDVLALTRDADPAHAAHVARPGCATSRSSRRRPKGGARSARPSASTTRSWSRRALEREHRARRASPSTCTTASSRSRRRAEKLQQLVPEPALPRRARADARARAGGEDARVPARRRGRARLDDDHRVGPRHPAGEHADRRARRPARARRSSTRSAAASAAPT